MKKTNNNKNPHLVVYLSDKKVNHKMIKQIEATASKNCFNVHCIPLVVTKNQFKNFELILKLIDVVGAFISKELRTTAFKTCKSKSKLAKNFKSVDFVLFNNNKANGYFLSDNSTKETSIEDAINIMCT